MTDYMQQFEEEFADADRPRARELIDEFLTARIPDHPIERDKIAKLVELANHFDSLEIKLDLDTALLAWALVEEASMVAPEEIEALMNDIKAG